jgi:hypothetical protein
MKFDQNAVKVSESVPCDWSRTAGVAVLSHKWHDKGMIV